MKNLIRILFSIKTESSTQMTVHLPHIESRKKNVQEFEKPNFSNVFYFRDLCIWNI